MSNLSDPTNKCILYIDDQSERLLSTLELFEDDYKYTILTEPSVRDGLDRLKDYHSAIDAVILDLHFPDDTLQGKDGLSIINREYPWMPVFILTGASDPAEEEEAKECLANGATNYYHKSRFDVKTLIIQIDKAIDENATTKRLTRLKNYQHIVTKAPFLRTVENSSKDFTGIFAYQLTHTITTNYKNSYNEWAKDVLRTMSIGFKTLSIVQLHEISSFNLIETYFVFSIQGKSKEEVDSIYKDVFFNFSLFFNQKIGLQPAVFSPITVEKKLVDIITLESKRFNQPHYLFKRDTIEISSDTVVEGFSNKKEKKTIKIEIPIYLLPHDKNFEYLFYLLNGISDGLISTRIKKVTLTIEEISALIKAKKSLKDPVSIVFLDSINDILSNQNNLFQIETYFYSEVVNPTAIINRISELYFQNRATQISLDKKFHKEYPIGNPFERFPFIYSLSNADSVFSLPYLSKDMANAHQLVNQKDVNVVYESLDVEGVLVGKHSMGNVHIEKEQFEKHTYIIGKTGTGKTSILYSMCMDQINKGQGAALIDPHGDVFDKILANIPKNRKKDIVVFDPTNIENDFGFNILDFDKEFPEQQSFIVNELLKIFSEIYDMKAAGGPMFETYFKNAVYLVMEIYEQPTLNHIEQVFNDELLRKELLSRCRNKRVTDFFAMVSKTSGEQAFENFAPYITSKLTRFTDHHLLRKILCDPSKSFNFRKMIDSNTIFLVKLNKGRLGSEGVNFIGRLLFNKIIMAGYTRENIPENERKNYPVFVDEFHNFTSGDLISALAEARKYHLQLILANQTFAQLEEQTSKNILANVGTIITAALSPYDAVTIAPFLEPEFNREDIIQLDNYKFILKTMYNNKRVSPFVFNSIPY
ncbi:MAG: type IV secretion system DNA-binding domain-containing protein [Flavobacteriaceae bacterium]|nr:type IV secretion system DNA-binding domain-containing protein [Flavobacteriaceae bacterium]